jgi:type IV secretory pathway VirB2 component (pilin)
MAITGNRTNTTRNFGVLALAMAILALAAGGTCLAAQPADEGSALAAPVEGTWLNTITRINQGGTTFTAVVSFAAGGVWQATGSNDHQNGGVSTLFGSWKRVRENLYSSRAYFFAFDPSGNPVVLLRVDQLQRLVNKNQLEGSGLSYACSLTGKGQDCVRAPEADVTFTADRVVPPSY